MGVPERRAHIEQMCAKFVQSLVPGISAPVVHLDEAHHGPWWTNRLCWQDGLDAGSTHHLVLQDDVTFCLDFPATVVACTRARPTDPLSFFSPRSCVELAAARGLHWVQSRSLLWGQAMLMPRWMIQEGLAWIAANEAKNPKWGKHDDDRWRVYYSKRRRDAFIAVPNPVQHIGHRDGIGSVMGHHAPPAARASKVYIGDDQHGAELPWSQTTALKEWMK